MGADGAVALRPQDVASDDALLEAAGQAVTDFAERHRRVGFPEDEPVAIVALSATELRALYGAIGPFQTLLTLRVLRASIDTWLTDIGGS